MSAETYERMLPVITLLLGAAIGWWVKRSESRRSEVLEAGDTLAQIPNYIWRQGGEDSWLNLQVFLSRLRTRLRAAGVPDVVAREVDRSARLHWRSVESDGENTYSEGDAHVHLNAAIDDAHLWLFGTPNVVRRRRARRRSAFRLAEAEALNQL